jgi:hypothetical protein
VSHRHRQAGFHLDVEFLLLSGDRVDGAAVIARTYVHQDSGATLDRTNSRVLLTDGRLPGTPAATFEYTAAHGAPVTRYANRVEAERDAQVVVEFIADRIATDDMYSGCFVLFTLSDGHHETVMTRASAISGVRVRLWESDPVTTSPRLLRSYG